MEPKALAMEIAKILDDKKASRLKVLRVHDLTVMADYFVIASGTSSTHVKSLAEEAVAEFQADSPRNDRKSLAEEVEFKMKENFETLPIRTEGFHTKNWFILDYASVIVHVFTPEARDFYDLEHLWADGEDVTPEFDG